MIGKEIALHVTRIAHVCENFLLANDDFWKSGVNTMEEQERPGKTQ